MNKKYSIAPLTMCLCSPNLYILYTLSLILSTNYIIKIFIYIYIYIYIYKYIYIYIYKMSSTDRSLSFYQNSSVWLDILDSRNWD